MLTRSTLRELLHTGAYSLRQGGEPRWPNLRRNFSPLLGVIAGGRVTAGGNSIVVGYDNTGDTNTALNQGVIRASAKFTAPNSGNITSIEMYSVNATNADNFKVGLYTGSTAPTDKVGSEVVFTNGSGGFVGTWSLGWKVFGGLSIPVISGSNYWICIEVQNGYPTYYYRANQTANSRYVANHNYTDAWPSSFSSAGSSSSLYCYRATLSY